ncbi:MAG: YhdH/YhfP family quinone oxidoreductase [Desulfobulbaceae bacterium]|nr:YhdH/YhfP family quinone oxidoreductase [Desulfobulbaceae bacterium]
MDDGLFAALVVRRHRDGSCTRAIEERRHSDLPAGEVLIRVYYSSLNYKDALSGIGAPGVSKVYPHTPGVDAAGVVVDSNVASYKAGDEVLCTGYDLGMNTPGGFGQFIRVPARWIVRKPPSLSLLETMQFGTAGYTAGLSVLTLQENSVARDSGNILVSGATGGVGSVAVHLLSHLGYQVTALTSKEYAADFLYELGAVAIETPQQFLADKEKLLLPARWAGVVDTVGGEILAAAIKSARMDGIVTCCGNAASHDLPLNVYPFILRGVRLIGIYSAESSMERRLTIWKKFSEEWKPPKMAALSRVIPLSAVSGEMDAMLAGKTHGRIVVDMQEV